MKRLQVDWLQVKPAADDAILSAGISLVALWTAMLIVLLVILLLGFRRCGFFVLAKWSTSILKNLEH